MRLTIIPDDQTVLKDGAPLTFAFAADSNVHAIQWYDTYGTIEYKSGPAEHFTDESVVTPFAQAFEAEKQRLAAVEAQRIADELAAAQQP
jgi:hypothetical protein